MPRGLLITLEGIDGTGKTTQSRLLAKRLRETGRTLVETREPGGAPGAEEIRRLLLHGDAARWSAQTEILLFTAARRDHMERVILPALEAGQTVICDRFVDSTRAYQGAADPSLRVLTDALHRLAIGVDPDRTLILDLPAEAAAERMAARAAPDDRFEARGLAFQARLRDALLEIARAEPERCRVVDANGREDEVAERLWASVADLMEIVT